MNSVCPYCSAEIEPADANQLNCPTCGEVHHGECWEENGGCTVFGCASAPADGPTLTVELSDLPSPPPPPPVSGATAPPPPPPPIPRWSAADSMSLGGYNPGFPVNTATNPYYIGPPRARITYILLGVFLGMFGAHNFYAGYTGRAVAQLCITLLTLFMGAFISWTWAIVEVCTVDRDCRNMTMV
jgi:hypothetical protein